MANALYPYFKQVCLDKGSADSVDMNTDAVKIMLIDATAVYNAAHKYLGDLLTADPACDLGRSPAVTTPTVVNGTFDCDDPTVTPGPAAGKTIKGYVAYKATGVDGTSTLIAWVDHDSGGNAISLPGNGADVTVQMDAAGLFDL